MPCMNCPLPDQKEVCGDTHAEMYLNFIDHLVDQHVDPGAATTLKAQVVDLRELESQKS